MILTHEQLVPLFQGALGVDLLPNGFTFPQRFTEPQREYYRGVPDRSWYAKALATSGIRLEMITDSDMLAFEYTLESGSSRKFAYFDLAVDGALLYHVGYESVNVISGNYRLDLPAGTHRITLYLPCLYKAALKNVTLSEGATFAPVDKKLRLYAVGDSITQGYDAVFSSGAYHNLLADMLDAEVVNHGIGGEVFRPEMLNKDMNYTPDIITVAYGTNDWSKREKVRMTEQANEYYRLLREYWPNAKIFALTPIWRADHFRCTKVGLFEEAKQIVAKAASAAGAIVIDGDCLIPHTTAIFRDNYLHPNDLGFRFYAENLYAAMKPYL